MNFGTFGFPQGLGLSSGLFGLPTKPLWTPSAITTALWLDASDISTITIAADYVSQWNDKSGNLRHAIQTVSGNRPLYSINAINGLNTITFNGSTNFLEGSSSPTGIGTCNDSFTLVWAGSRANSEGGAVLVDRLSTQVKSWQWSKLGGINYISSDGLNVLSNHTIADDTYNTISTSGGIVSHTHVLGVRDALKVNGSNVSVLSGIGTSINGSNGYRIGVREGVIGAYWNGGLWEFIGVLGNISSPDIEKLEGYLAHKWGRISILNDSHPYKITPPYL